MPSQFALLQTRRFLPFFVTQFLGAFNDNLYKNALVVLLTFESARYTTIAPGVLVNLAAGLFILPFFVFSALGGRLADKFEKSGLIRATKLLEIAVMALAVAAFALDSLALMLVSLFLMGAQSALFGPVKYAILPVHLDEHELVGGNALVEAATFVAILVGTIAGGVAIALPGGAQWVSAAVLALATLGYAASRGVPPAPAAAPGLVIGRNPFAGTLRTVGYTRTDPTVFAAVLAISWFWFYGALFLSQFPGYAKDVLGGDEAAVTLLLAVFSVGIGAGSLACARLSRGRLEPGLVPLGAIGLTVFALDLWWASGAVAAAAEPRSFATLLGDAATWRVLVDLLLIGACGGLFIVPLYTLVQLRAEPAHRSRVIAGINILNALFMVAAAGLGAGLLAAGLSVPQLLAVGALLNAAATAWLCLRAPEFARGAISWLRRAR